MFPSQTSAMPFAYVILAFILIGCPAKGQEPIVNTTHGLLSGLRMRVLGRELDVFLSVPFAAPPVGSLRFRKPSPAAPWEGVRNATEQAPTCPQTMTNTTTQEDCLYLNIWAPRREESQEPKAIMLWIHGGGFEVGSIALRNYNGSFLSALGDVIVVAANYRLGPLGFLFLSTPEVPGNMGLWDQTLALEWIHDNARSFGGDPQRITIFGQSAGAVSVGLLTISPRSPDFISRAIMESGNGLAPWSLRDPDVLQQRSLTIARGVGCPTSSMAEVTECLRGIDPLTLARQAALRGATIRMGPVVDGDFLPARPEELFREGRVKNFSVLIGNNLDEISTFLLAYRDLVPLVPDLVLNRTAFVELTRRLLANFLSSDLDLSRLLPAVLAQYEGAFVPEERESYLSLVKKLGSDVIFNCPDMRTATLQSSRAKAYYYVFEHFMSTSSNLPRWLGVKHADELAVVFGMPFDVTLNYTEEERNISRLMMSYWTNFAKTGNPNQDGLPEWPEYDVTSQRYASLSVNVTQKSGYRVRECAFWNDVFPLLTEAVRPRVDVTSELPALCTNGGEQLYTSTFLPVCLALLVGLILALQ